jgi:AcrR family transcriptional regulator
MGAPEAKRKKRRSYDATGRQQRARSQHDAALNRAQQLFLERGYTATTVESIAQAAGVSTASVYKTYGGKVGLVRELCERALRGHGTVPAQARSDILRVGDDPRAVVSGWSALASEVSPRVSPLALLLRTAAESDPEAATLYAEISHARLDRMAENARYLADSGHLRPDVAVEEARDVLWLCTSPEFYDLMVLQRGWSPKRFTQLVDDTITGSLL